MKILLNTTPLGNAHSLRGIGMYTRLLQDALKKQPNVELVTHDPDLVHIPFFDLFFNTLPIKKKTPTVVTIHDVIPLLFPQQYPAGVKGKARLLKQKFALKSVAAVITDSHASKWDIVEHLGVPASKIHVVHLAANPELQPAVPRVVADVRQRYQLMQPYILYVGDINYNKNLPQLIKALKFLPAEIDLVLVGKNFVPQPIPEWQEIERQIALSDVADRVKFIPTVGSDANKDLSALYSGAECYVQPSLAEGFGLPVLEAMQCRTPAVVTANSSLVEVAGEHAIYSGTDAEALAEAIMGIRDWSRPRRQRWLVDAQEWTATYSWDQVGKETAAVYHQVLAASLS